MKKDEKKIKEQELKTAKTYTVDFNFVSGQQKKITKRIELYLGNNKVKLLKNDYLQLIIPFEESKTNEAYTGIGKVFKIDLSTPQNIRILVDINLDPEIEFKTQTLPDSNR